MIDKDQFEKNYCSLSRTPKIQDDFLQFLIIVFEVNIVPKHVNE